MREPYKTYADCLIEYERLLDLLEDRREAIKRFDDFLREETAWLEAPASTRFHLSRQGGLVEHSVNVARVLLQMREVLDPALCKESCVIVGLYHDLGKAGMPGQPYYLPVGHGMGYRDARYTINKDLVHMDIASRSLFLVSSHLPLTEEEAQAIRYHDGQYIPENRSVAHRECALTVLLQWADNWSGCFQENQNIIKWG